MNETITVDITQEDIDLGESGEELRCPIALALDAKYEDDAPWEVDAETIRGDGARREYRATAKVARFIELFDANKPVHPATFQFRRIGV